LFDFRCACALAAVVTVVPLAGCGDDATAPDAPAATDAVAEQSQVAQPSPGPALWKVADADTTVYLFGTFHALKPGIEWFNGPVKTAYEASSEVALEATDAQDAQLMGQLVLKYAVDPQGRTLSGVIGPELASQLGSRLAQMNLSLAQIEPMEPWMAVMTLAQLQLQSEGFAPELGVDVTLQAAAAQAGKTLTSIEGAEAQLKLLDSFPEDRQIAWLSLSLRDWDESPEVLDELLDYWRTGNVAAFADEMAESMEDVPNLNQALMVDRNEGFADWVVARMAQPGVVFMAIGAGHLAGSESVQDFLRDDGFAATRL
jgi:uncharacterized protein YbaP (TraB family)